MSVTISRLSDRPELIDQLALAYEAWSPRWYGPGGRGDARADLRARAGGAALPLGLVAAEGPLAVGTCALAGESMSRSGEFGAWLVGLWVAAGYRRRGIALDLVRAAAAEARRLGLRELRAGTATAASVFERAGWTRGGPIVHDGEDGEVFALRP
jgi:GNAT superfamily N-acetyltransferase